MDSHYEPLPRLAAAAQAPPPPAPPELLVLVSWSVTICCTLPATPHTADAQKCMCTVWPCTPLQHARGCRRQRRPRQQRRRQRPARRRPAVQ